MENKKPETKKINQELVDELKKDREALISQLQQISGAISYIDNKLKEATK